MGGVLWFGTAALVFLAGCDVGVEEPDEAWRLDLVSDSSDSVPRLGPLLVAFDRRLSPWSVDRGTVRLTSSNVGELIFPAFDPITRQLVVEFARPLLRDTGYLLSLQGLRDLDGAVLESPLQLLVHATDVAAQPPIDAASTARVLALLKVRCANGGCHDATMRAAELVLDSAEGIERTALGQISRQAASPSRAVEPTGEGLVDLPIIAADGGSSSVSRSYLIYKVLGDTHALGEPMPPSSAGPPLNTEETDLLASWIAGGSTLE